MYRICCNVDFLAAALAVAAASAVAVGTVVLVVSIPCQYCQCSQFRCRYPTCGAPLRENL